MTAGTYPSPEPVEDPEALRADEAAYRDLADAVRELLDLTVRTRVDQPERAAVATEVRALSARLSARAQDGPLGLETTSDGRLRDHGNPMVGMRNPIAPPLTVRQTGEGEAAADPFVLGAAYEGPPGHVHGGIIASVLDQVLGTVPAIVGRPGMTAYLNLTYRRPTPLGQVSGRARVAGTEGWKTTVTGELLDADGQVTVEAEGLFVVPRWARQYLGTPTGDAGDFEAPSEAGPGA